jgi:signal transduction histidine kinase
MMLLAPGLYRAGSSRPIDSDDVNAISLKRVETLEISGDAPARTGLAHRPSRPPAYDVENQALLALAAEMAAGPAALLQALAHAVRQLCGGDSVAVSIFQPGLAENGTFRWHVKAGDCTVQCGDMLPPGTMPPAARHEDDAALLLLDSDSRLKALATIEPRVVECLFAPLWTAGELVGAVWVMSHHAMPAFDTEHARLLTSLARFTSHAYRMAEVLKNTGIEQRTGELKRAEVERSDLLRRFVRLQENERRRISRELHDQMGQLVAGLALGLRSLEASVSETAPREKLRQLQDLAAQIGREIHNLALELRPAALDDLGLSAALANYVQTWSQQTGIEIDFHASGLDELRLASHVETALYRVVQESLTNVARHAAAQRASLILERRDGALQAIVEDDGQGFDVEAIWRSPQSRQRLGLLGMQERLTDLGGSLEVESAPGRGTTVFARVPIKAVRETTDE